MIKDFNRNEVDYGQVFHFQYSLRPFILVINDSTDDLFLDIETWLTYTFDELSYDYLTFYRKEDDPDFLGVDVICTIKEYYAKV